MPTHEARMLVIVAGVFMMTVSAPPAMAQDASAAARIAEAVSPLPESLRAGATVVVYDATGNQQTLRQGTNAIICQPNNPNAPGFFVQCYHRVLEAQRSMEARLLAQGTAPADLEAATEAAISSGTLTRPATGTMIYVRRGPTPAEATVLWVMQMPEATGESTGLSTSESATEPWLMFAGTPRAHIMMPQATAPGHH